MGMQGYGNGGGYMNLPLGRVAWRPVVATPRGGMGFLEVGYIKDKSGVLKGNIKNFRETTGGGFVGRGSSKFPGKAYSNYIYALHVN